MKNKILYSVLFLLWSLMTLASDVQISKGSVVKIDQRAYIDFRLAWDLSWHNNINWDAVWVFGKNAADGYSHIRFRESDTNKSNKPEAIYTVNLSADMLGAMVYRTEISNERSTNLFKMRLEWDYRAAELELSELPESIELYAIEMVYIPEGPFDAGDPNGIKGPDNAFFSLSADSTGTYRIDSRKAIPICEGLGSLCYQNKYGLNRGGDQKGPLPGEFPKGFKPFYLMKYKVTQGQYAVMLNTLTDLQSANRAIHGSKNYADRGSIKLIGGRYIANRPHRACHYLGWEDSALFADWAALRPYTELEYEKASRGPKKAVANEYAWGTTRIMHGDTLYNPNGIVAPFENGDEYIAGNANYRPLDRDYFIRSENVFIGGDGGVGPLRVDIFEKRALKVKPQNLREAAGASYYGVIGLTGGLFERVVSIGTPQGRNFAGTHGDGKINYEGFAENTLTDWPSRTGEGLGLRARNFAFDPRKMQMANRGFGHYAGTYREAGMGFRAARTAENTTQ